MPVNHATDVFVDSEGKLTEKGLEAMAEYGERLPHYHVVEFINGCLNDWVSGPDTLEGCRAEIAQYVEVAELENNQYEPAGTDRFTRGLYILKIEECYETECEVE